MKQLFTLFWVGLKQDFAHPDRWLSPLLFGFTIQLVFTFARGELPESYQAQYMIASFYVTLFLALQASIQRCFDLDLRDRVFELMRTMPISASSWYLAKWLQVTLLSFVMSLPLLTTSVVFFEGATITLWHGPIVATLFIGLLGLAAIGVMLALLVASTDAKAILFPLLFVPLTVPVLLASMEFSRDVIQNNATLATGLQSWLGLLIIVDVVALTLGILLFNEYLQPDA